MLYKVVLTFESVDEIKSLTIQLKAPEQYFLVVLFIMLYKAVLTFESVDEILKCDHSNESFVAILSFSAVYYALQDGSNHSSDHSSKTYQEAFFWVGDGRRYMQESNMFELVYGKQRRHKHFWEYSHLKSA